MQHLHDILAELETAAAVDDAAAVQEIDTRFRAAINLFLADRNAITTDQYTTLEQFAGRYQRLLQAMLGKRAALANQLCTLRRSARAGQCYLAVSHSGASARG